MEWRSETVQWGSYAHHRAAPHARHATISSAASAAATIAPVESFVDVAAVARFVVWVGRPAVGATGVVTTGVAAAGVVTAGVVTAVVVAADVVAADAVVAMEGALAFASEAGVFAEAGVVPVAVAEATPCTRALAGIGNRGVAVPRAAVDVLACALPAASGLSASTAMIAAPRNGRPWIRIVAFMLDQVCDRR